jgi:hypothetical protein
MFKPRFSLLLPAERRKDPRVPKLKIVRLTFDDGSPWLRGMMQNLSAGGACVAISTRRIIPSEFVLLIPPNTQLRCRLVWQTGDKIGVAFVDR